MHLSTRRDVSMPGTTTIRVSRTTCDSLNELADRRGESVAATVNRAVELLKQEAIGIKLSTPRGRTGVTRC